MSFPANPRSRIVRELTNHKWTYAYQYLISMPELDETSLGTFADWQWKLVRKPIKDIDDSVELYQITYQFTNQDYCYIQQYYYKDELVKQIMYPENLIYQT